MNKLASICIPTYNSAKFISLTLETIINQTYKNIEIIIGDNASTDNTEEIVKGYIKKDSRITYYKNETNLGYSENCNKLISLAKGEYISIYHSDDVYDITIVEKEVKVLENNSGLAGIFTLANFIDETGNKLPDKSFTVKITGGETVSTVDFDTFVSNILVKGGSSFFCPTSMIRKKIYEEFKGCDSSLKYIEDQDIWARILKKYSLGIINEKLINYRIHVNQGSSYYKEINREEITVVVSHIESFLKKNNIQEKYHEKIKYAKAVDCVTLAQYAFKMNNFRLFRE